MPTQQTTDSVVALRDLILGSHDVILTPPTVVEFHSVLRKLCNRGRISDRRSRQVLSALEELEYGVTWPEGAAERGFELATQLGHSDTFDTTGYAVAEALGAEFWVSDRRFADAAARANLPNVRFVS